MSLDEIEKQLKHIEEYLHNPFPYRDMDRIQNDFSEHFSRLSENENWLTADFDTYCMNIAGTLSYAVNGEAKNIPNAQMEMLKFSFFEFFQQYKFFEGSMNQYHEFYEEYMNFERARQLLLEYLSL